MMELNFVTEFDFGSHSVFVSGLFTSDVECDKTIYFRKTWFQGVACTLMIGYDQVLLNVLRWEQRADQQVGRANVASVSVQNQSVFYVCSPQDDIRQQQQSINNNHVLDNS